MEQTRLNIGQNGRFHKLKSSIPYKLEFIPIKSSFVAADRNAFQIIFSGQF